MKFQDLKSKGNVELHQLAASVLRDGLSGRIQRDAGSLKNTAELSKFRRIRARILTELRQRRD